MSLHIIPEPPPPRNAGPLCFPRKNFSAKGVFPMHIPSCPTQALEVVPFDAALAQALEPSPEYDITKWIYVPNH